MGTLRDLLNSAISGMSPALARWCEAVAADITALAVPPPPNEALNLSVVDLAPELAPSLVNNGSTQGLRFVPMRPMTITGLRFYWFATGALPAATLRCSLWKTGVGRIAQVDVAVTANGPYTVLFPAPVAINPSRWNANDGNNEEYFLTVWETTNSWTSFLASQPYPCPTMLSRSLLALNQFAFVNVLDAIPTTWFTEVPQQAWSQYAPVEPLFTVP